jgi:glycerophosphoryl diester phosphodiesterase
MRVALCIFLVAALAALTGQPPRVTLSGLAVLPPDTFAPGPPSGAWLSADKPGVAQFASQPVQGVSGLTPQLADNDGRWWALSDNGFGAKLNSNDYLLRIYALTVEWSVSTQPGRVVAGPFIQLADPDRKLPFPIAREQTAERWLTGADLDPESLARMPDGTFWIGDEFGPFLLHVAADGRLLERPYEVPHLRSPDHPHVAPADAGQASPAQVGRSRGFEGVAHFGGGLYAALESGTGADAGASRIYEFNLDARAFTGQS